MDNLKQFNTMGSDDWRTQSFRQSMVARIEDAIQRSGLQMPRNSSEMENQVYMKATTREDYMSMIAKLILHVREMNANRPRTNRVVAQQSASTGDSFDNAHTTNPVDPSTLKTYSSELKRMYSMSGDSQNSKKRKDIELTISERHDIDMFSRLVAQKLYGLADANDRITAQLKIMEVFKELLE